MDYTLQNCQKWVDDWIHDIGIRLGCALSFG